MEQEKILREEKVEIPLMKFEDNAFAPILRYDIPSPSSYEGRNYIELKNLKLDGKYLPFNKKAYRSFDSKDSINEFLEEFLETNRENIFSYLTKASKVDLERDLYLVFDLDELKPGETVVQYPGTYSFTDGTLEGWELGVPEGSIVQVMDRKRNHNKVVMLQGTPGSWMLNRFKDRSNGIIELWVEFANFLPKQWANQIRLIYKDNTNMGGLYSVGGNLYWYTKDSAGKAIVQLVEESVLGKWTHLKISWNGNNVNFFVNGKQKLSSTLFPGCNLVDGLWIGSWYNQEIWIDAVGYSWDPEYKIGNNLIQEKTIVSHNEVRDRILASIKEDFQPEVVNILNSIQGEDKKQLREKYRLFKFFIQAAMELYNRMPIFYKTMGGGKLRLKWVPIPEPDPRLMLIETYKLTSFPGDYGAGTTIKTFSLLPDEKTEISIKTWKKSIQSTNEASSILDSYTDEKADEFERNVQTENSCTSKVEESNSYHAEVGGGVSWGVASISASAGTSGGTSSGREEFAKNVMNATDKHSQTASAKREVNIETSFQKTEETGEEVAIMRNIENLNASRTLNFTFRQLNQQFHSLLHLTDVRLAFFNGLPGSIREYALYELESLVKDYMMPELAIIPESESDTSTRAIDTVTHLDPEKVEEKLREYILGEYSHVMDYNGDAHTFLEEKALNSYKYLRVIPPGEKEMEIDGKTRLVYTNKQKYIMRPEIRDNNDNITQKEDARYVDGIITGHKIITMKTDGIIVESLLGKAEALDEYAVESREETVRHKQLENERIKMGIEIIQALIKSNKFEEAEKAYNQIFGKPEGVKAG